MTDDDTSAFDEAKQERRQVSPDEGYVLVAIDKMCRPGEALTILGEYDRLDDIQMPPATELTDYVVYDSDGKSYTHEDVQSPTSDPPNVERLRRHAESDPETVDVAQLLPHLKTGETAVVQTALRALERVADVRPADCTAAIPVLRTIVHDHDGQQAAGAMDTLRVIGSERPADIAPLVDCFRAGLESGNARSRRAALRCLSVVAEHDPEDVLPIVEDVGPLVTKPWYRDVTAYILNCVSKEQPAAVEPYADRLAAIVSDDTLADDVRMNATAAIGRLVAADPALGLEIVADVTTLLDADDAKLRNNAIALLGDIAQVHTDTVEPHVEEITACLSTGDTYTRINGSGALARVAEDFPDTVAGLDLPLTELLDDENPFVRENACWLAGYIQATAVSEELESLAKGDTNEDVRKCAAWALTEISEDNCGS